MNISPAARTCTHVTVLNPALHPRIYYKYALSQQDWGWQVCILGQDPAPQSYDHQGISIVPTGVFGRGIGPRLGAIQQIYKRLRAQPPDLVVIHAPELLWLVFWLKWKTRARVIYDVHENYEANLRHGAHHPRWVRALAGLWRAFEKAAARRCDLIVYAEQVYANCLDVPERNYLVLRNAFAPRAASAPCDWPIPFRPFLLVSGAITADWGVLEAIEVWRQIRAVAEVDLVVAGFASRTGVLDEIRARVRASGLEPAFHLLGGATSVPYPCMVSLIRKSVGGFALYRPTPQVRGKIPTKFFEFQALGKPLLFTPLPEWVAYHEAFPLGISWQPDMDAAELWQAITGWNPGHNDPAPFLWDTEALRLKKWLNDYF